MSDIVDLNVGGVHYTTSCSTLTRYPDSMLARMFSGHLPSALDKDGRYFIDRDGVCFRYILNFLRTSQLPEIHNREILSQLQSEADFYQLKELSHRLSDSETVVPVPPKAAVHHKHLVEITERKYVSSIDYLDMQGPIVLLHELVKLVPHPSIVTKGPEPLTLKSKRGSHVCSEKPMLGTVSLRVDGFRPLMHRALLDMGGVLVTTTQAAHDHTKLIEQWIVHRSCSVH